MRYPATLRDSRETDDEITQECIVMLAKGAAVIAAALAVLWIFI